MAAKIYSVSTTANPEDQGDIFYGTITQFQDCFCSNEMDYLADVEYYAKEMFGADTVVLEHDEEV